MVAVFADPEYVEGMPRRRSRGSRSALTTAATRCCPGRARTCEQVVADCAVTTAHRCTWLETSHAFHSELLDPVLDEFESFAGQFRVRVPPTLPLVISTGPGRC